MIEQTKRNADLDFDFEGVFDRLFKSANDSEKMFLTFHKYCLRKKYVGSNRVDQNVSFTTSGLYSLFLKLDSYGMLAFKIFLNLSSYLIFYPMFCLFKISNSKTILREVKSSDTVRDNNVHYYPGSFNNFVKSFSLVGNVVNFKCFVFGISSLELPRSLFLKSVEQSICNEKPALLFRLSLFFFYVLYSYCYAISAHVSKQFKHHDTYGAVIAPQKLFSLAFLSEEKDTHVISHGNFHDPQCIYQPASEFVDISDIKSHANMSCSEYFVGGELLNPFLPIHYRVREGAYESLRDIFSDVAVLSDKSLRILVFSSTYDRGIGRDPYFGIINIIRILLEYGYENLEIKLHPSESKFFFKLLHLAQFGSFTKLIKPAADYSDFDVAFGMPSTFICDLVNVPKIYVYSPLEYINYDFVHGKKVGYFSEIA